MATHAALRLTLPADTETAVGLYHRLSRQRPGSFLLETAHHGAGAELSRDRYSFVGFDATRVIASDERGGDVLEALAEVLARTAVYVAHDDALPPLLGGAVGYVGYDAARHFEPIPLATERSLSMPEAMLLVTHEIAVLDHLLSRLHLVVLVPLSGDRARSHDRALARFAELEARLASPGPPPRKLGHPAEVPPYRSRFDRGAFEAAVREAQHAIEAGELFQVVLSQRLTVERRVDPFALYRALRSLNPSPYMFLLRFGGHAVVGSSPETLVKVTRPRPGAPLEVCVRPIAGTRRRGADAAEDEVLAGELAADPKELAEHRMLLDLGRNDVGRVARIGSVTVEREREIERYSHVMHLVSEVRGELAPGRTALDAFRAAFPAGTVSGAPKIRAMEHIAALEPERRGVYAGAVGYFGFDGQSDTCIAIRTVVVEEERAHVQAGAGIVLDSIPSHEHDECLAKARGPLTAIAEALLAPPAPPLRSLATSPSPPPSPAGGRGGSVGATDEVGGAP